MLPLGYLTSNIRVLFELAACASCEADFEKVRRQFAKIHSDVEGFTDHTTKAEFADVTAIITNAAMSVLDADGITSPAPQRKARAEEAAFSLTQKMAEAGDVPASQPLYHSYRHYVDVAL